MTMLRVGVDVHQLGARQTGNETYLANLLSALVADPHLPLDLVLYRTRRAPVTNWALEQYRVWPHQPAIRIPVSFPLALRRDRIDVAHFQYVSPPICPCPVSLVVHDISYETHPEFFPLPQRVRMKTLVPLSVHRADVVITVSEYSRQQIIQVYGIPPTKVVVTPNAVSGEFRELAASETARRLVDLDVPPRFLLAVGNVQPRKNVARLIAAYAHLRRGGVDAPPLLLVGQMHYRGHQLLTQIDRLGMTPFIRYAGYVTTSQLVALYNRAVAFVYPSVYEGFGLPILEAMACGTPVVTGNCTAMPEVAGSAALLVDPLDIVSIAQGMATLLGAPDVGAGLRARGRERVSHYSWATTAAMTRTIWQQIGSR